MTDNKVLMSEARETLRGKWGVAVGVFFLYMMIGVVVGSPKDIGPVLTLLIEGPLLLGMAIFILALNRKQNAQVSQLFEGFNDYLRALATYIIMAVFILLWSLLLIVPGVIAALSYSLAFFVLAEDKNISAKEALDKSKALMQGHKKKMFYLWLRFLGWFLVGIITAGFGFIFILPYFYVTLAKFYEEVKSATTVTPAPSTV